jgi:hypothetical protein
MKTLKFTTPTNTDTLPLFIEFGRAYLRLDLRDGSVDVVGKHPANLGSMPSAEWHNLVLKWEIPNTLTHQGINELFNDPIVRKSLTYILNGCEIVWDGNNQVGKFTSLVVKDENRMLEQYLIDHGCGYHALGVGDVGHWLAYTVYEDLVKDGENHERASKRLSEKALREGYVIPPYDIKRALDIMLQNEQEDQEVA